MKRAKYTPAQIIGVLKQHEAGHFYSPEREYYDKTWQLNDFERQIGADQ